MTSILSENAAKEVLDPTANVIALLKAAEVHQNDLLAEHKLYNNEQVAHIKSIMDLRAEHSKQIHLLEAARINAVRDTDVAAIRTESERAQQAIQALAAVTASNAETLRTALNQTANTIAAQTSETVNRIVERIAALEKSSYEGAGKQAVADPMISELVKEVRGLRTVQENTTGKAEGVSNVWLWVFGGIAALGTLLGIGGILVSVILYISKAHGA
jgi:hypothetical protein